MKKKLRLISLFLACSLLLSFFAACGGSDETTQGAQTTTTGDVTDTTEKPNGNTDTTEKPDGGGDTPTVERDFAELSTRAAGEGIVLLKNEDSLLPFGAAQTVAMFGKAQVETVKGGGGSGDVYVYDTVNILEGVEAQAAEGKIRLYEEIATKYRISANYTPTDAVLAKAASNTDAAIYVISRNSWEGADRTATAGDYYLSNQEIQDIEKLISAGYEDIVVLLNVGGMMDTTKLLSYPQIKSIMLVWQPGQYGGNAIGDVLVGDINPSGKLADTFAKDFADYPSSATLRESEAYVKYTEDVYVGYRYFETFDPNYEKVNFEFGFGLSYTTFSITDVVTTIDGANLKVTAKVTNTGTYSGKEVVQVYFSAPQGVLGKPAKELAGFAKTKLLAPNESETVTITFAIDDMSSYDDMGHVQKSAYVMEAGDYRIFVGNSVRNAGERGVAYTYTLNQTKVTEQLTEQLAAKLIEKRLKADGSYENIYRDSVLESDQFVTVSASGVTKIEGEDFVAAVNNSIQPERISTGDDVGGYSVAGLHNKGYYVSYALKVEKAGAYRITMRVANGTGGSVASCYATVNNVKQDTFKSYSLPTNSVNGNQWFNFETFDCGVIMLNEGMNNLTFTAITLVGNLNWFTLEPTTLSEDGGSTEDGNGTTDSGDYITVSANGVTKIEAEKFTAAVNSAIQPELISTGDDAGGYSVAGLHRVGYYVSYTLKAEKAGNYRITMRIANGASGYVASCSATVNNVRQDAFTGYELPTTSVSGNQWFNFKTLDCGVITLNEGVNTLTFAAVTIVGNFDWFTLEPVTEEEVSVEAVYARAEALANEDKIMFADLVADPSLMEAFIDQLTLEELVHLLYGHDSRVHNGTGSIGKLESYEIPGAETADGPAGIRSVKGLSTAWPIQTMLACTWNTALVGEVGDAVAQEAEAIGVDIWLAPGVNIHRTPLCGRNFEYYSEDPLLSGELAAALINSVQGRGIGVAIKHLVGNETEVNRTNTDSRVSERALREIYLKPFEIAVKKADPWLVMSSYNKVNGVETAESYELCTNILRGEWGYKGLVTTDWANNSNQYKEILAGNDLKMHHTDPNVVLNAVENGLITREQIEVSVQRVLEMIMKTNAAKRGWEKIDPIVISSTETNRIHASDHHERPDSQVEICEDIGGGINLSSVGDGHYIKYFIDVEKGGTYTVSFRVATTNSNCYINFYSDGVLVGTIRPIAATGGWQKWKTTDEAEIKLTEGVHELKIEFKGNSLNPNYFDLTFVE